MFRISPFATSTATRPHAGPPAGPWLLDGTAGAPTSISGTDTALETMAPALLEAGFRTWVESFMKSEALVVGTGDPVVVPIERALLALTSSTQLLAPAHGATLGLDADVTIGAAASALLQACIDPDGPRCRSYRSATFFLVGRSLLDLDDSLEDDDIGPEPG